MLSDDTSSDSETGIRYKTQSTRGNEPQSKDSDERGFKSLSKRRERSRSRSRDRYKSRQFERHKDNSYDRRRSPVRNSNSKSYSSRDKITYRSNERDKYRENSRERNSRNNISSSHRPHNNDDKNRRTQVSDEKKNMDTSRNRSKERVKSVPSESVKKESQPTSSNSSVTLTDKNFETSKHQGDSSEDEEEQRRKLLLELKKLDRDMKKTKKSKSKEKKSKKEKRKDKSPKSDQHSPDKKIISESDNGRNCASKVIDNLSTIDIKNNESEQSFGPSLPSHLVKSQEPDIEGPALPAHLKKKSEDSVKNIGPYIPDNIRSALSQSQPIICEVEESASDGDDNEMFGPMPSTYQGKMTRVQEKLEERALKLKLSSLDKDEKNDGKKSREEWMLELPAAKAGHFGLGPRQFRAKEGPDLSDRSMWTDTPEDKKNKAAGIIIEDPEVASRKMQSDADREFVKQRDREQEQAIKKHKKKHKRNESLVEIHQKKLEKKKRKEKKESGKEERRPFSRDLDLKVNKFDDAQKKAIMKKAQLLDSRFSSGEAKFL